MNVHRVMGKFRMSRRKGEWQRFSKEVISESEEEAIENVYSLFGSKHRVKRTNINIYDVEKLQDENIEDESIKEKLETED